MESDEDYAWNELSLKCYVLSEKPVSSVLFAK